MAVNDNFTSADPNGDAVNISYTELVPGLLWQYTASGSGPTFAVVQIRKDGAGKFSKLVYNTGPNKPAGYDTGVWPMPKDSVPTSIEGGWTGGGGTSITST